MTTQGAVGTDTMIPGAQVDARMEEAMPNLEHGAIGARLARYLDAYTDERDLGRVFASQTTFVFAGTPPTRYPDLAFVAKDRLPSRLRAMAAFAPDLAVEVVSETDTINDIEEKVLQYQHSGVRLVWVIRPVFQTVEVYELGNKPRLLTTDDLLRGDPVVPGFALPLGKLFA